MDKGIIIFDGYCNFCSSSILFIIQRDKKRYFSFAASQTGGGQKIIARYGLGDLAEHSIVLVEAGKVYRKSSAVLRIARQMGWGWSLLYICIIVPRSIRDYFYDLVARSRYRLFGMSERCFVPDPDIKERFLPDV